MTPTKDLAGGVRIVKRIRRNKIWKREPFTYAQAWLDLLLLAVDAPSAPQEVWARGERLTLQLGQVGWSIAALAEEWHRSREWVMAFLKFCQREAMIMQTSNGRGTVITILNYEAYQAAEAGATSRTTDPGPPEESAIPRPSEIPADEVLEQFFAEFRDVARGAWRASRKRGGGGWVASRLNARKWPADWQRAATMAFLADVQAGHPKALAWTGAGLKNRAADFGEARLSATTPTQRRFELARELEDRPVARRFGCRLSAALQASSFALRLAQLSTPHCCDAVTVRYRTMLHRTETDFPRSLPAPSQAHEHHTRWGTLADYLPEINFR